jgi:DNA modification methylase
LLLHGDCLDLLQTVDADSIDAIVTDPPYGLSFMGKRWDYDVPSEGIWRECLRVLKPGGHLLAFAGTRTQHRMAVRIEDAGFEIRDMIAWVYGSGFPKSHNGPWGGTALKPALEPITVARKPLEGTVAANVLAHGTGGLNIDATRIMPCSSDTNSISQGRWPANLIHDGSEEVLAGFPQTTSGTILPHHVARESQNRAMSGKNYARTGNTSIGDTGSAARFFYCAKASKKDRDEGLDGFEAKVREAKFGSVQDARPHTADGYEYHREPRRNNHPTVKPTDLMRYLCRLVTPLGGTVLDPFMGSGSTGKAARLEGFQFIGIERDADYFQIAQRRIAEAAVQERLAV